MIRRGLIFGAFGVLLALVVATSVSAAAPEGPRLAYLHFGGKPAVLEIASSDAAGGAVARIAGGGRRDLPLPFPLSSMSWSANGSAVVFAGITSLRGGFRAERRALFLAPVDGGKSVEIPGTVGGLYPVSSADGSEIAYLRIKGRGDSSETLPNGKVHRVHSHSSIWLTSPDGKVRQQLTPWTKDTPVWPSSFSPDGSTLGVTLRATDSRPDEAVALRVDGSGSTVIARHAGSPVYSPDGTEIALLHVWHRPFREELPGGRESKGIVTASDLFVVNADGSGSTRLTKTGAIEASPAWDPSGRRLAYVRLSRAKSESAFLGIGDSVMEINADGSCATKVLFAPKNAFLSPAWQPGPGRGAGPIAC